jgi:hypothetical protein
MCLLLLCATLLCLGFRADLVEQLLAAGASVSEPEDNALLQPLHLACMGRIQSPEQVRRQLCMLCTGSAHRIHDVV